MATATQEKKDKKAEQLIKRRKDLEARVRHLDSCPEERLESFIATGPRKNEAGAIIGTKQIITARCMDCGEDVHEDLVLRGEDDDDLQ